MNNTMLAVVIGGILLLGLGVVGLIGWSWGQAAPNRAVAPVSTATAQGQMPYYNNTGPLGSGMMGPMMQGWGTGGMNGGMMGSMMQSRGMGNMRGWGMSGMHGGMMGGWGCCGRTQSYTPSQPQQPTAIETNAVELRQFAFGPSIIKVRKGMTVTWTNRDSVPHTVTASNGSFRSGLLQTGQSWSFTFDKPGTYSYYCEPHPFMQGQVIVEDEPQK